jgi:hypothetical protein
MDLGELVPAGIYGCWRVVCTTQPDANGWRTETSGPYLTRDGAIAGAATSRSEIDASRGGRLESPWHQTNLASSQLLALDPLGEGEIAWENTWGEMVTVRRSTLVVAG